MTQQSLNPLLQRVQIPGETFRLPSRGLFYTDGELDPSVRDGEVQVFPMTAIDEILMRTPDALFTGKAIVDVFKRCVPEVLKPTELLARDVDYLLTCLRMMTYGPTMDVVHKHTCENAKEHSYTVQLKPIILQSKTIDPTVLAQEYEVTLPNGQIVMLHPPKIGGIIKLYQSFDNSNGDLTQEMIKRNVIDAIANMIGCVKDPVINTVVSDQQMIMEWLMSISAGYTRLITDAIDQSGDWGPDFITQHVCRDCGEPINIEVSTNPLSFFS